VYYELVVARLDASAEGVAALATHLSRSEKDRAARFHFERDRRRYTVARGRLRELLASRLGEEPHALEFVYGENGKPALADASLHFNVSHCEDVAVYALCREREIGVDVEALHPIREADGIAAQFFSRAETEAFRALGESSRTLGFYNCWTRKEAMVKATGAGLAMPLDGFAVSLAPGDAARVLHVAGRPGDGGWRLHSFTPRPGFVAALAIAPESAPESVPDSP
jgi:4'-phosphopantetheinyl transferase